MTTQATKQSKPETPHTPTPLAERLVDAIGEVFDIDTGTISEARFERACAAIADHCNAHDALVSALEGMLAVATTMDRSFQPADIFKLLDAWAPQARAALALAEEK